MLENETFLATIGVGITEDGAYKEEVSPKSGPGKIRLKLHRTSLRASEDEIDPLREPLTYLVATSSRW